MDAAQLRQSLMTLYWSTVTLADILRCPTEVVMGWYYGNDPVPAAVGEWLARLTAAHDSNPPPLGGLAPQHLDQQ
jgi:hypothetical protein